MHHPLVSVIIPNYNHAPYLRERIDSVLNQRYDNFEVIILDDKSTDNSVEIIETYRNHPRITQIIINDQNSGSTFIQWQKGFSIAKGEYIWIAESDDVAHPDFLKILINAIGNKSNVVMACSRLQIIDQFGSTKNNSGVTYSPKCIPWEDVATSKAVGFNHWDGCDFLRKHLLLGNRLLNASSMIFKKSALPDIPLGYMNLKASGDYMFYVEISRQGEVIEVPQVLDRFRRHTNNVSPRLTASGISFENDFVVYSRMKELGLIDSSNKSLVVGFRLWQIKHINYFNSEEIKRKLIDLWSNEVTCPNWAQIRYFLHGCINKLIKICKI